MSPREQETQEPCPPGSLSPEQPSLSLDDGPVYTSLKAVFESRQRLDAQVGVAGADAVVGAREQTAEDRGGHGPARDGLQPGGAIQRTSQFIQKYISNGYPRSTDILLELLLNALWGDNS